MSARVYLERLRSVPVGEYLAAGPGDAYPRGVAEAVLLSPDAAAGRSTPALGRLAGGSLLSFSGDGDSVTAHRLVMRVVRERARRQGTLIPLGTKACGLLDSVTSSLGQHGARHPCR